MLKRLIGEGIESQFDDDDVLSEAYIRAEARWDLRPGAYEQLSQQAAKHKITPPPLPNNPDSTTISRMAAELRERIEQARQLQARTPPPRGTPPKYHIKLALDSKEQKGLYVWLYGIVHEQFIDMYRRVNADKRGGLVEQVSIPDNSAAEIAQELWRSQTGASTIAERKEFVSKLQCFLERELEATDLEIVSMKLFDRLEYAEIATELVRRAEGNVRAAEYQKILAALDSRSLEGDCGGKDAGKRRADAIRKRFNRAVGRLTGAILDEFPELQEALPRLSTGTA